MAEETKQIGQLSWETAHIVNILRDKPEGSVVTYDYISSSIGLPKALWYDNSLSAREFLEKQSSGLVVWKPTRGKPQFYRLNSAERVELVGGKLKSSFKTVKKCAIVSENIDYTNLTNEQKNKAILLGTVAKAANSILSPKSIKQAEQQKLYTPQEYIKRLTGG